MSKTLKIAVQLTDELEHSIADLCPVRADRDTSDLAHRSAALGLVTMLVLVRLRQELIFDQRIVTPAFVGQQRQEDMLVFLADC